MIGTHRCAWRPCRARLANAARHWPVDGGGFACCEEHRDRAEQRRKAASVAPASAPRIEKREPVSGNDRH